MHISVLTDEIIKELSPQKGETILDGTAGGGGHTLAIAKSIKGQGKFIFIDRDQDALDRTIERLKEIKGQKIPILGNFSDMKNLLLKNGIKSVDKIILDLGWSNFQTEDSNRGFSFQKDEPLLMTYKKDLTEDDLTAKDIVNLWSEENLILILKTYGEESWARKIAGAIVERRKTKPFETSGDLADLIKKTIPRFGKIHPATKTFQALRIAVNNEIISLQKGLKSSLEILNPKGRIAVISFHSLEDREVKNFFKQKKTNGVGKIITKKPIRPTREETLTNRKARSAKLRIFEKK